MERKREVERNRNGETNRERSKEEIWRERHREREGKTGRERDN